jgi:hypothetical protein
MTSRLNTEWTKRDVQRMRAIARAGHSARFAAGVLGRSRGSVAFKAMRLKVRFGSIKQPKGVQRRIARRRRARS